MKITLVLHKYDVPLDDPCCYPLGFMYVSSVLKAQGHKVKVLNYNLWKYDFVEEVKDQDVVCFTGFEEFAKNIIRDSKICRELGIWTVLGGALATFTPEIMKDYVDQLVVGEFEETSNIDQIPWPDYEGFGIDEYHKRHDNKYMGILTSRGCPFNCTFCSQTCKVGLRSLSKVFGEIAFYKSKYKINTIVINDNTFNLTKSRFMQMCRGLKKLNVEWGASIRCDIFDEDMARAAKDSNCTYFVVGIESFSQRKLDRMNKRIRVADIYRTLGLLNKYKIKYHGNILVGFDNESYADIAKEISILPRGYNIFPVLVQPFIGTKDGQTRLLTDEQANYLDAAFTENVINQGMYKYPSLEKAMGN